MYKVSYCIAAMAIVFIFLGTLAGFLLVDMSFDTYMPGQFDPIFEGIESEGSHVVVTGFGRSLYIPKALLERIGAVTQEYRGLAPAEANIAGRLTVWLWNTAKELEQNAPWNDFS
ncbi:hypothetical protein LJC63_10390 [Ruminococcaceae bacterium OttesenSCG-928-L11]|nr:hypothetical protein [Ruminococcaceae bacterium OttesenSCG-928-L11]